MLESHDPAVHGEALTWPSAGFPSGPWPDMTEKALQGQVNYELRRAGWRVYHTHRSDRSEAGFPDVCAVRGPRLLFAELKRRGQHPTKAQAAWLDDLIYADCEVWVVTPDNLGAFYASACYDQPVPAEMMHPTLDLRKE